MRCVLTLLLLTACGRLQFAERGTEGGAGALDSAPDAPACTTFGAWGTPELLEELSTPSIEYSPSLTPDELTVYFQSQREHLYDDLFIATRATRADAFGTPVSLALLSSDNTDRDPSVASGGVYFTSDRPTGDFLDVLYRSAGSGDQLVAPAQVTDVGAGVYGPWVSYDELDIYYGVVDETTVHRTRASATEPWGSEMTFPELGVGNFASLSRDQRTIFIERDGVIMVATRADRAAPFSTPVSVDAANTGFVRAGDPEISSDGLTLYFAADVAGNSNFDLYRMMRPCLD